jgi:cystathionine gamma-synthase
MKSIDISTSHSFETITSTVRAGIDTDEAYGAVIPSIVLSSNYSFAGFNQPRCYDYTRSGNPTRDLLGEALAELEGGSGSVITATGMAAITLTLALLKPEDTLVVPHDCYGGSWRLFNALAKKNHFHLISIDFTDEVALRNALAEHPKMVWIETPSNPLLRITDIQTVATAAKQNGAIIVVDNTFLSPLLQTPLTLGADIVVHSTTKYINGHSDVVGGAVIAKNQHFHEQLTWWANALGLTGSPFDSFLTLRGLRTLDARLRVHEENTLEIVRLLESQPLVKTVHFPGLSSHPQHELATRQQKGFGGMISFELEGGIPAVEAFLKQLNCFTLANSLGGVESLIAHPSTMTHASMSEQARKTAGIGQGLLRLSIGIEALNDIKTDLNSAFNRVSLLLTSTAKLKKVA